MDFKRVIWHESFSVLLNKIAEYSKVGVWEKDAFGHEIWLFPFIHILSGDFEELQVTPCLQNVHTFSFFYMYPGQQWP